MACAPSPSLSRIFELFFFELRLETPGCLFFYVSLETLLGIHTLFLRTTIVMLM